MTDDAENEGEANKEEGRGVLDRETEAELRVWRMRRRDGVLGDGGRAEGWSLISSWIAWKGEGGSGEVGFVEIESRRVVPVDEDEDDSRIDTSEAAEGEGLRGAGPRIEGDEEAERDARRREEADR